MFEWRRREYRTVEVCLLLWTLVGKVAACGKSGRFGENSPPILSGD